MAGKKKGKKGKHNRSFIKENNNYGKKKKNKNNKKNIQKSSSSSSTSSSIMSLEETLKYAEEAIQTESDPSKALSLYTKAAEQLRTCCNQFTSISSSGSGSGSGEGGGGDAGNNNSTEVLAENENEEEEDSVQTKKEGKKKKTTTTLIWTLIKVLSKLGEIHISLGDPETARSYFTEAISIQEEERSGGEDLTSSCSLLELVAGIHFYLGQLSSNEDALKKFKDGIQLLERGIQVVLQQERQMMNDECDDGDGDDGEKMDDDQIEENKDEKEEQQQQEFETVGKAVPTELREHTMMTEDDKQEDEDKESSIKELYAMRKQLCSAHCSIAELYLTDLCFENNAEEQCEHHISKAMALDSQLVVVQQTTTLLQQPPLPDAPQTMANLRLSQRRFNDAAKHALMAYERMKEGCEALSHLLNLGQKQRLKNKRQQQQQQQQSEKEEGNDDNDDDDDDDGKEDGEDARELVAVEAAQSLPPFEFRCQLAKLLLECCTAAPKRREQHDDHDGDSSMNHHHPDTDDCNNRKNDTIWEQCAEAAVQILASLLAENDEVIEIWYLMGCAFMSFIPREVDYAIYYWERCSEMLTQAKEQLEQQCHENEDDDDDPLTIVKQQLEEVQQKLADIQSGSSCYTMEEEGKDQGNSDDKNTATMPSPESVMDIG